jgi:hypothetical protein
MKTILRLKAIIEYLGGCGTKPPEGFAFPLDSLLWGLIWGALCCVIAVFCGQTSKFIYIDF